MTAETWANMATVAAAIIALLALIGSFGSWRTAHLAKQAAATLTAIEARRWHADMTPQFEVTCVPTWMGDHASDTRAELRIRFTGPPGLNELTITPTVRDDWPDRKPVSAGGPTREEIAAQIWGPYRFVHGVDGGSEDGRTVAPFRLLAGDGRPFALERTTHPRWTDHTWWRQKYDSAPVRVALHCLHGDDAPWTLHFNVPVSEPMQG